MTGVKYAIVSNAPLITNDNLACNKRWNGKKGNGLFHNMRDCLLKMAIQVPVHLLPTFIAASQFHITEYSIIKSYF